MWVDPTGLLSEAHEEILNSLRNSGSTQDEINTTRSKFVDTEINKIKSLEASVFQDEVGVNLETINTDYESAVNDYLRNIIEGDYSSRSKEVDQILNNKLAYEGMKLVGTEYMWEGKPDNNKGGLDCSGVSETVMERAVNILVKTRNANDQARDPNLTVRGDGSRGTLNYYNWGGKGAIDHVAIALGDGRGSIINPDGGPENSRVGFDGPWTSSGMIQIRGPFITVPENRQVNWRYMLFE